MMLFLEPHGAGAGTCVCRWLITGLYHGVVPVSGWFSPPFQVISCILYVNTISPTCVNICRLISATPFKVGTGVFQGDEGGSVHNFMTAALSLLAESLRGATDSSYEKREKRSSFWCSAVGEVLWKPSVFPCWLAAAVAWVSYWFYISTPGCLCLGQRIFSLQCLMPFWLSWLIVTRQHFCWTPLFPVFGPFRKPEEEILTDISFRHFWSWC